MPKPTHGFVNCRPKNKAKSSNTQPCISPKTRNMFELSANGGNYQVYLKLALAIARSGVPDAENIFVEAASIAKDADPEEKLRKFFQDCEHAPQRPDGITVGTLFHYANQYGADFGQWKQIAAEGDPDVAMFVPGNEEDCRTKLARVVAADPCTFTLGDPSGPLVILRVPDKEDLAGGNAMGRRPAGHDACYCRRCDGAGGADYLDEGRPDGDRIAFAHRAISLMITSRRCAADTERGLCEVLCECRASMTTAIFTSYSGYDPQTGLFHDKSPIVRRSADPSSDDARKAAQVLSIPLFKVPIRRPCSGAGAATCCRLHCDRTTISAGRPNVCRAQFDARDGQGIDRA